MITMFAARLLCGLAVLAPVVLALPPTRAAAQAQLAPVQRAPVRPAVEMARVVDDGTNLLVLPIARLCTTERLYLRGADLAIVNSGAGRTTGMPRDILPRRRATAAPSSVTERGLAPAANICTVAYGSIWFNPIQGGG